MRVRLNSLDSVRGLAALVVLAFHASLIFPHGAIWEHAWLFWSPLRLLFGGPVAVIVFFVLSGVVLAPTFIGRVGARYWPYASKRLIRIGAPSAAALVCSVVLKATCYSGPVATASYWFNVMTWDKPVSIGLFARAFFMTGTYDALDNPMWSLTHEMRISLIFPFLVFAAQRNWWLTLTASIILSIVCVKVVGLMPRGAFTTSYFQTLSYIVTFVGGIIIAIHSRPLRTRIANLPASARAIIWVGAFAGLAVSPANSGYVSSLHELALMFLNTAAASLLLLLSIVEGRAMSFLLGPIPAYLGRISFSLYLTHVLVLATTVHSLVGRPLWLSVAVGVVLSFPVAEAFYRLVEAPSAKLSKQVAKALSVGKGTNGY